MKQVLLDRVVRQELAVAALNAAAGVVLALVVGIAAELWWVSALAAVATFAVAALSDRKSGGSTLTIAVISLFALLLAWVGAAGQSVLKTVPLLIFGTTIGFACNRILFGVIRPVPAPRRDRTD